MIWAEKSEGHVVMYHIEYWKCNILITFYYFKNKNANTKILLNKKIIATIRPTTGENELRRAELEHGKVWHEQEVAQLACQGHTDKGHVKRAEQPEATTD